MEIITRQDFTKIKLMFPGLGVQGDEVKLYDSHIGKMRYLIRDLLDSWPSNNQTEYIVIRKR